MAEHLLVLALAGCDPSGDEHHSREIDYLGPNDIHVAYYPYVPPEVDDSTGEFTLGEGGHLIVWKIPAGATAELYVSRKGQGPGPCTFEGGVCAGIVDPEYVATAVADPASCRTEDQMLEGDCVEFEYAQDLFDTPGEFAWQALVYLPEGGVGVPGFSNVVVRHALISAADSHVTMVDVTTATIGEVVTAGNTHTGGVAFVDYNGDYWPDVFIANGAALENKLFRNEGDGTFADVSDLVRKPVMDTNADGLDDQFEGAAVSYADIENDGDLDILLVVDNPKQMSTFVAQPYDGGPNLLYRNQGDGTFTEVSEEAGVQDPRGWRNISGSFGDYDRDGCVDLYMVNWAMAALPAGDNFDRLLHGRCDGSFEDVTATTGVNGKGRDGLVGFWWDADFDLYPELYVGNDADQYVLPDFDPRDVYYKNEGGVLREWSELPVGNLEDSWGAMGADVGDIDGDLDWDLYLSDVWNLGPSPQGNALYLGEDGGKMLSENACAEKGVCFGYSSWPVNFADFDNDGWIDLWVGASKGSDPSLVYVNRGDGTGTFDPHRQPDWSGHFAVSGTIADYDGDGQMDVFLWDDGDHAYLYRNESALPSQHWIELRLVGTDSNAAAIGARVELTSAGQTQMRRVSGGDSAHAQEDLVVHFGLDAAATADQIDVFWPSGRLQTFTDVDADRFWLVSEDDGLVTHTFLEADATWDWDTNVLEVTAETNYGGRAVLEADGYGPLPFNAKKLRYEASFSLEWPPLCVEITSDLGESTKVDVDWW